MDSIGFVENLVAFAAAVGAIVGAEQALSLIHIPSPRDRTRSRMPSSA